MKFLSKSPAQTQKIAADFAKKLKPGSVLGLQGDLGAGKTTFVQGLARGLGIDPQYYVNSPTFTLINEYRGHLKRGVNWTPLLIHVDLYRIEKPMEGETLGLEDYLAEKAIVAVEWIERMPVLEKSMSCLITLELLEKTKRHLIISNFS